MTDKKTEALKPCEYCGHPLPQGVDKRTRQIRSHHFASCNVRLEQKALEEQPAQQQQQQPVAWMDNDGNVSDNNDYNCFPIPLFTSPQPSKPWVGLTDEEISKLIDSEIGFNSCCGWEEEYTRAVEAKLKEKNT